MVLTQLNETYWDWLMRPLPEDKWEDNGNTMQALLLGGVYADATVQVPFFDEVSLSLVVALWTRDLRGISVENNQIHGYWTNQCSLDSGRRLRC